MKIGILGSGDVAQTLAGGFLKHGHEVALGTRDPEKLSEWQKQAPKAQILSVAETAAFGQIILLAVAGSAGLAVLEAAGSRNIAGKTIIDATNPVAGAPSSNGVLPFFTDFKKSLMEQFQETFPDAHFVKAFNSVGLARFVNPEFAGGRPTMFICGDDEESKKTVTKILDQFGWETADMGKSEAARAIEPLCILWCIQGFLNNEWTHAFKLLH